MTNSGNTPLSLQRWVAAVALLLFFIKVAAYYLTGSVAILSDALESTVNVAASLIGLYSLYLAAKPRDAEHPYGHGKVEFISAGIEGTFIFIAGGLILFEAIQRFFTPSEITSLDLGILLVFGAGVINFIIGYIAVKKGKKSHSLALEASGHHLLSDSYTTIALLAGLGLIWWTGYIWLDSAIALILSGILLVTGYRIVRKSIAGIMDEADEKLLRDMIEHLQRNRRPAWIDLHNLRVIKYGSVLHVDCHLSVPWYFNVRESHGEVDLLEKTIHEFCGRQVELFVHTDACKDFSCNICSIENCPERKAPLKQILEWTFDNVRENQRHRLP